MKRDIDNAAHLMTNGISIDSVRGNQLEVMELNSNAPLIELQVTDSMGFYSFTEGPWTGNSRSHPLIRWKENTFIFQPTIL